jgi:hypothetical protein
VDDHGSSTPGRRPEADHGDGERDRSPDQEYFWEGKPGEDFGPILPAPSGPPSRERRGPIADNPASPSAVRATPTGRVATSSGDGARTQAVPARPARRRSRRPILTAVGALLVLGALAAAVLFVITRQATESTVAPGAGTLGPVAESSPIASPAAPAASPAAASAASPAPAVSPTALALAPGTASPQPAAVRSPSPIAGGTVRPTPVIFPTPPALVTPPAGARFPTATPARLGTPGATRTPPAVPTVRPPSIFTRVWSDQAIHKVGDQASICAAAASGASAQVQVIGPDRSTRTLGELQPPAERVCYAMKVDEPGLYVLSLIVKDANGGEIDRQSAALFVGR